MYTFMFDSRFLKYPQHQIVNKPCSQISTQMILLSKMEENILIVSPGKALAFNQSDTRFQIFQSQQFISFTAVSLVTFDWSKK